MLELSDVSQQLPKGWQRVKLGERAKFINGRAYSQDEMLDSGVPIIRVGNLSGSNRWYYSDLELPEHQYCDNGDLLFAWSATFGAFMWHGSRAIFHYHIWKVEPFDNLDKDFAFYLLQHITESIKTASHGLAMLHMTKQGMENWYVNLPPLDEQKRIAARLQEQLNAVQKAREAAKEQLAAVRALPSSYLRQVFYSREAENWQRKKIAELARTCSGSTPSRSIPEYFIGKIPWVKTGELKDGEIGETEEHISELALKETSLRLLPAETLLVAMYGQGQTRGRTGLLSVPATTNQACFAILPNPDEFHPPFLQFWFRHSYERLRAETESRGGNQPNLNGDVLNKQEVVLPAVEEQKRIAKQLSEQMRAIEKARGQLEEQLSVIERLPSKLLETAFNGQL